MGGGGERQASWRRGFRASLGVQATVLNTELNLEREVQPIQKGRRWGMNDDKLMRGWTEEPYKIRLDESAGADV